MRVCRVLVVAGFLCAVCVCALLLVMNRNRPIDRSADDDGSLFEDIDNREDRIFSFEAVDGNG